jgi:type IV pilus assembly protein PilO
MDISPRQLIFIGTLLAVPVAAFFLVFKPQSAEIRRAKAEIEVKRAMLASLREVTAQAPDLAAATGQIEAAIEQVESRLPSNKELDNVLRDVAQSAARSGLRIPKFVKSEQTREAGTALEQPLDVELAGEFDGFYKFLLELERLPRITRLTDMNIQRVEEKGKDGLMRGSFKLSIYYQAAPAAPATAGKTVANAGEAKSAKEGH